MKINGGIYTTESYKVRPYKSYRAFYLWLTTKNRIYNIIKIPLSRKVEIE